MPRPSRSARPSSPRSEASSGVPPLEAFRARVARVVALIPRGHVATYGQVAALAGAPRRARHVGRFLATLPPGHGLPWHRVLNAQGRVSPRGGEAADVAREEGRQPEREQERLLAAEGVRFVRGRLSLARYRWRPEEAGGAVAALLADERAWAGEADDADERAEAEAARAYLRRRRDEGLDDAEDEPR